MLTLGLDPSLRAYGWCVYDSCATPRMRRIASGHDGTLPMTVPVARFMHFRSLVADLLRRYEVEAVGIESPAYESTNATAHFALMMFSLEPIFARRKDCVLFDPATLKLAIAGKGNADKSDMQRFVQLDTMSSSMIDNNEADAYCIARAAARFIQCMKGELLPEQLTANEARVFLMRQRKRKKNDGSISVKSVAHAFRENSRWFQFSKVPAGSVDLPAKSAMDPGLLAYLESHG
jgi:Holliday junction resolvasome RuvABC endonuclease subunit